MKTKLIPIIGDTSENLYQIGLKEADSFKRLEERVVRLLSANDVLRHGQDIISRARSVLKKKKEQTFFDECVAAYSEGLKIQPSEYLSFLSLFELAAHYGQVWPELKGILPGCTSLFRKTAEGISHARLIDFPLLGIFESNPRVYFWKCQGKASVLNYSCEGLAPIFFQAVHQSGFTMSLHHKPGVQFHKEGQSIFQIAFDGLFDASSMNDFRKELKKKTSVTKWGFYMLDSTGTVISMDLDGPASNMETFGLNESPVLVFNNVPIRHDANSQHQQFLKFCHERQDWLKTRANKNTPYLLDLMTDVKEHKGRGWKHPSATLTSVGALEINLTKGTVQIKEGEGALVASDAIIEFSLADQDDIRTVKAATAMGGFERAWKRASRAQESFDQGDWDQAYHHLQMAISIMPDKHWKEVFNFFLQAWNFKFVTHDRELSQIYRTVKALEVPDLLKDQWYFLCMRLEKRLGLSYTIKDEKIPAHLQDSYRKEKEARPAVFAAWMKLLYPRMEIFEIFSPHHR